MVLLVLPDSSVLLGTPIGGERIDEDVAGPLKAPQTLQSRGDLKQPSLHFAASSAIRRRMNEEMKSEWIDESAERVENLGDEDRQLAELRIIHKRELVFWLARPDPDFKWKKTGGGSVGDQRFIRMDKKLGPANEYFFGRRWQGEDLSQVRRNSG